MPLQELERVHAQVASHEAELKEKEHNFAEARRQFEEEQESRQIHLNNAQVSASCAGLVQRAH